MSDTYLRSESQMLINAIGTELCWGWSPAIDFLDVLPTRAVTKLLRGDSHQAAATSTAAVETGPQERTEEQPTKADSSAAKAVEVRDEDELDALMQRAAVIKKNLATSSSAAHVPASDVKVLMCGAADIRHIFRTLASLRVLLESQAQKAAAAPADQPGATAAAPSTLHFYIYETNLRVHARHVFFLQWLCDSLFSFNELEDRVAMFLEVFGNSLLRDTTASFVKNVTTKAIRSMSFEEGALASLLDFSKMKSKEKDFVEEQMKYWTKDSSVALIEAYWNKRLRTEMAERYDNKENIIDWDYNFQLYEYTNAIKFPEYRAWRNTGIAFDYCHINPRKGFTYSYTVPNKTLCHFERRGAVGTYAGDIKNGPFFGVGVDTRNELLRPRNYDGTLKYGNGVTAMHNVRAWLYELMTGKPWPWGDHLFAWDDVKNYNLLPPGTPSDVEYHATLPNVKIHFVGLELSKLYQSMRDAKTSGFDAAFVGSNCAQFMTHEFFEAMQPDAVVVAETVKFVIDARDEAKAAFIGKVDAFANEAGWQQNAVLTALLHRDQPAPRQYETALSEAQKKSALRLQSPFQVALSKAPQ